MVDVGESQCAEECFKWEEFEEADEDEAREEGQLKVEASIVAFSSRRFDLSGPCIDYRLALVMLVNGSVQQCSNGEVFTLS